MDHAAKAALMERIKKERSAVLIVNTQSRHGRDLFLKAVYELQRRGIAVTESYPVREPDRLPEVVKEAVDRGHPLVLVGGGDGTVSSVVDYFANKDVVFGLLPLGTGNSFARTLEIPLTLEGAVEVIAQGKVADVDLGQVDGDYFANVASLGFSSDVARSTPHMLKRYLGVLAYGLTGLKDLFTRSAFRCTLKIGGEDGEVRTIRTHQLVVANGSFFGITRLAPDTDVDDRELVVFTMATLGRWRMAWLWLAFFRGKFMALRETLYYKTKEVIIETDPPQYVDIDGEVVTKTPVRVTLAPQALKVMVPLSFREVQ